MAALDSSLQFDDDLPRCPRCGKRQPPDAARVACAGCGYEFIPRRARVHCGHCGRRIPAEETLCPHCGKDPHPSRFPFSLRVSAIFLIAIALGCGGWLVIRAFGAGAPVPIPPTSTSTPAILITVVVATPIPRTATPTLTPTRTATPTPTSRFSPTPTPRGTRATATRPATATPIPTLYPAPKLLAPLNTTIYTSADADITLAWQSISATGLRENEWYMIWLSYVARDGKRAEWKRWSKETRWNVIKDWYADIAADARTVSWNVTVMRVEGADPFGSPSTPGSAPSATWTIIWK